MKAKELRDWCDRMGDEAEVEICLTTFYSLDWSTQFVAESTHTVAGAYGSGSKNGTGRLAPRIVLPASHTVRVINHPCPQCRQDPPRD
jgi:hypothetical protein